MRLSKWIPLPVFIGIIASILMWKFYGAREFWKNVLSWIIGITIISIEVMALIGKGDDKKC